MFEARTISISIDRPWRDVYEAIWRPERFPEWATGLSGADLRRDGDVWRATGPDGPVEIDFTAYNAFGVMDHRVRLEPGREVFVPLRVVPNRGGAEVMLTLFVEIGTPAEAVAREVAWIGRDLAALKRLLTP